MQLRARPGAAAGGRGRSGGRGWADRVRLDALGDVARDQMGAEGVRTGYLLLRALPLTEHLRYFSGLPIEARFVSEEILGRERSAGGGAARARARVTERVAR